MGKKAVKDLEEAASLDPKWPEPRIALARIYRAEGKRQPDLLAKAEALLREARDIRPKHLQTLAALADVLVQQGKFDEALAVSTEALSIGPSFTPALLTKGRCLIALRRAEEARAVIEEAYSLDPRNAEILAARGEAAAGRGDWKEAAEALRKAVELKLDSRAGGE